MFVQEETLIDMRKKLKNIRIFEFHPGFFLILIFLASKEKLEGREV